jgi:hypothetical protein
MDGINVAALRAPAMSTRGSMKRDDASRRGGIHETVNWRRRVRFSSARVSSYVRELESRSEVPNVIHLYMTSHFNFLDFSSP